jgi:hypothetical protein
VLSYTHELSLCETEKGVKKQWSVDERLSNVSKGTKIASVITVVFYTGENAWDGPRSLHDMLLIDEEIDEFIPDYPLHIIDLGHDPNLSFANEDLEQLRVALSSIYSETAETCNYEIKDSILALTGILSNDQQLDEYVNETKGGVRPRGEARRKRDERIKADVAEEWSKVVAERDSKLAEQDSKLAEKDRKLAEKEAEIMALKEQLRLAQA